MDLLSLGSRLPQLVPQPRRFTVLLGPLASIGTAATSFHAIAPGLVVPVSAAWLAAFAVGAEWRGGGPAVLTVMACLVKATTVALVVAVLAAHSAVGPHNPLDWIPLGMLNAATCIWFLRLLRHQAQ
jgi:hypothetical protein